MKLYRQIVEEYPDSPYASQAKARLAELEKARFTYSSKKTLHATTNTLTSQLSMQTDPQGICATHKQALWS